MRRSAALAALSRDHHHALQAALRLRRAGAADLDGAVAHLQAFWEPRGRRHFEIEQRLPEDDLARLGDAIERAEADGER